MQYTRSNSNEMMKNSFIIFGPKLLKSSMVWPGFCKPTLNSVLCTGWREKNCAKIAEICLPRLSIEKLDSFFMNSNCGKETKLLFFCNKEQQNTYIFAPLWENTFLVTSNNNRCGLEYETHKKKLCLLPIWIFHREILSKIS